MKKITLSLLVFFISFLNGYTQVQIGDGNINYYSPIDLRYDSSYSQVIYLGSELNATGTITSIEWYYNNTYETPANQTMDVYIGNTTKTEFTTIKDWELVTNLTKVYSGRFITNGSKGWKKIILTTPFEYDGSSNIVVAVNSKNSLSMPFEDQNKFLNTTFSGSRSLIYQTNGKVINPEIPPTFSIKSGNVPNTIFGGLTQACETPKGLEVSNITTNSATITWDIPNNTPSNGSEYYISTSNLLPDSNTIPKGSVTSGQTLNAISLNSATYYNVWVRNNCGNGNVSAWSIQVRFITLCAPTNVFFEDCEGETVKVGTYYSLPKCWSSLIRNEKNNGQFPAAISLSESNLVNGEHSITMGNGDEDATKVDIMLVSPILEALPLQNYRVKFWTRSYHQATLQIGTVSSTNPTTAVFSKLNQVVLAKEVTQYTFDLTGYNGTDRYIAFKLVSPEPNSNLFIDDIVLEPIPTCPDVNTITVPLTTPTSATITWQDTFNTDKYQVAFGLETDTNPNTVTQLEVITSLSQVITGLTYSTKYKVWVRSICENSRNGAWIGPIKFETPCNPISEIHEKFDAVTVPNLPSCWSKVIRGDASIDFSKIETYKDSNNHSSPNTVRFYQSAITGENNDMILVTPLLQQSTLTDGKHRLVFYARKNFDNEKVGYVQIVTLNSNTESSVYSVYDVVELSSTLTKYSIEFTSYTGTDSYIGFRLTADEYITAMYVDSVDWEEIPTCYEVNSLIASSIKPESATISWTPQGNEPSWEIAYSTDSNDNPDNLEKTIVNTNPTTELLNLFPSTNYTVWVRVICEAEKFSKWSDSITFTTKCAPISSFNETFTNAEDQKLPTCWNKILRGETLPKGFANVYCTSTFFYPEQPTTKIAILKNSKSGIEDDVILVSPNLNTLKDATYRLRFLLSGGPGILEIGTLNSNDDEAIFTKYTTVIPAANNVIQEYIIDFSGYSGTDTYIGFRTDNNYQSVFYLLDNIIWEKIPLCPNITKLTTAYTTPNSANLSWESSENSNWEVKFGPVNENNPDNLASYKNTTIPFVAIEGLTPNTAYKIWVRSICSSENKGTWSSIITTSQCVATNLPYTQDFESAVTPNFPECTSAVNLSQGFKNWYVENNPLNGSFGFTSKTLTYNSDIYTDANAWYFTQGINLMAGVETSISFRYGGASDNLEYYNNNLKVMYGIEPAQGFMTLPLADYVNFAIDSPIEKSITFTPATSGVYYFGFNVYSPNNSSYMFIDDIVIDVNLSTKQNDWANFNYYPSPVKDILNINYLENISSVSVYNLLGQEVLVKAINENNARIDMTSLSKGTYLVKVTANNLVKTIKVLKD